MTAGVGLGEPLRVVVRRLGAGDWATLRGLRLRALTEDASHFLGSPADEETWDPSRWESECRGARWLAAGIGDRQVALAVVRDYPAENPRLHLEAMWVAPEYRRRGIGALLVRHAEEVARQEGHDGLGLWVLEDNPSAQDLYLRLGYAPTGRHGELPDGRPESELSRDLGRGRLP